jgi:hypothetical protein
MPISQRVSRESTRRRGGESEIERKIDGRRRKTEDERGEKMSVS